MSSKYEKNVYLAMLAEQCNRFEEMVQFLEDMLKSRDKDLSSDERNLQLLIRIASLHEELLLEPSWPMRPRKRRKKQAPSFPSFKNIERKLKMSSQSNAKAS